MKRKVIIIGSGPAGYTAAIYASRAGLEPLMFTGLKQGGQLMDTGDVENFPGYKDPVSGPQMMEDIRLQAERVGTEIKYKMITNVDFSVYPYVITDEDNNKYLSQTIIVATGAEAKWLGLESEKKYMGIGVSACATCDGFFFKGKDVIVVGGGDTACEEASYLSNICNKVTMLVRSDKMRASKIMQKRILSNSKIEVRFNTAIEEIIGDDVKATGVLTSNGLINADGIFIAIGHTPNTDLFQDLGLKNGYIVTKPGTTLTDLPGVFACGDVQDPVYRQAITAAGTGCMAALDAERFLSESEHM